ncbi:MAG: hypothetical protein IT494_03770, partial [Gammaproteobacteria bacterium]|nr:hypothetical protein [Gammaproteobacteria bacterium]
MMEEEPAGNCHFVETYTHKHNRFTMPAAVIRLTPISARFILRAPSAVTTPVPMLTLPLTHPASVPAVNRPVLLRLRSLLAVLGAAMCIAPGAHAQSPAEDASDVQAKFQFTYNGQKHGSYRAAYSGANSLGSGAEKMYTVTATASFGARAWQGGEIYFNPEIAQGVPLTGALVGVGGLTNGEITRAAGPNPTVYRQRLFLRQTWNHGGGSEEVGSDFNQLPGSFDKNRTVLTVGNFSALDVFDPNSYAKDPRTQFMNWGNWTYAAYDYAADSRGFGWGLALEWYRQDWVLRAGRMTGPKEPNGLPVDFALGRHYGDQIELEHAHALLGRPGKVRVLGWRNRARLASFGDALAWLGTH